MNKYASPIYDVFVVLPEDIFNVVDTVVFLLT